MLLWILLYKDMISHSLCRNLLRTCSSRPLIRQIPLELPGSGEYCSVVPRCSKFQQGSTGLVTGFPWSRLRFRCAGLKKACDVLSLGGSGGSRRPSPECKERSPEKPEDPKGQDQSSAVASKSKIENTFLETQRTSDTQEAALLDAKASWNRYHSWAATLDVHKVNGIGYDHDRIHYPPQCKHRPRMFHEYSTHVPRVPAILIFF